MTTHWGKLLMVAGAGIYLSSCASSGPSLTDYSGMPGGDPVKTSCGGGYQIFDKPKESRLLVTPYSLSAVVKAVCDGFQGLPTEQNVTGIPFEEAAREYFLSVKKRTDCRITGGIKFTALHSEFTYFCPDLESEVSAPLKS